MKPGVYAGISNADYHNGPGVSKSMLDVIAQSSPLHLYHLRNAANDNQRQPTPAQRIGTMFHALLLEPELFDETHCLPCVVPDDALVTSDDIKAALKDAGEKVSGTKPELVERLKAVRPDAKIADEIKHSYAVANAGRTIMTPEEWHQLSNMRDAVNAHPVARRLLPVDGHAELSVYWTDEQTGELCRCRPDFWRRDGILVDLKTTEDASPEAFAKSLANWRYHVQHPFYVDGVTAALRQASEENLRAVFGDEVPQPPKAFVFLAVEKTACVVDGKAKGVAVYVLDHADELLDDEPGAVGSVELGRALYRRDLAVYAECKRTGMWPGYSERIQQIRVPGYEFTRHAKLLGG